jgi:hypothetical protein
MTHIFGFEDAVAWLFFATFHHGISNDGNDCA